MIILLITNMLKGFAQLFLISALCVHRQVCQCYAGGSFNGGSRSPLLGRHNPNFHGMQPHAQLEKINKKKYDVRRYNTKLGQASIVVGEDEGDKGLSVRGGDVPVVPVEGLEVHTDNDGTNSMSKNQIIGTENNEITVDVQVSQQSKIAEEEVALRKRKWPCGDVLDKQLIKIALPCIANFAINPLVGAVDLFWINRMGNTLAVAGQAAANQIFSSSFWLTSFLPSGEYWT